MSAELPPPPDQRTLGKRVAEIREELLGMDREQLADVLSVSPSAVARWEQGAVRMPADALIQVARLARVSLDWLARPPGTDRVWAVDLDHVEAAKKDARAPDVTDEPLWRTLRRRTQVKRSVAEMQDLWKEITGDDAHPDWF